MANVKRGQLVRAPQWARHLRPYWKRLFWKKHRRAERSACRADETTDGGKIHRDQP